MLDDFFRMSITTVFKVGSMSSIGACSRDIGFESKPIDGMFTWNSKSYELVWLGRVETVVNLVLEVPNYEL